MGPGSTTSIGGRSRQKISDAVVSGQSRPPHHGTPATVIASATLLKKKHKKTY